MAKNSSFNGELLHFGFAILRVTGSGDLKSTLYSLDDFRSFSMPIIPMAISTNREPLILGNFTEQRACFEFRTTELDETFKIGKIVLYVKVVATGYPQ